MTSHYRPLGENVLVRRIEAETQTDAGLFIPDVAQKKGFRAEVVAVGPGRLLKNGARVAPVVKAGDRVVLGDVHRSHHLTAQGELIAVRERDLLAVLED